MNMKLITLTLLTCFTLTANADLVVSTTYRDQDGYNLTNQFSTTSPPSVVKEETLKIVRTASSDVKIIVKPSSEAQNYSFELAKDGITISKIFYTAQHADIQHTFKLAYSVGTYDLSYTEYKDKHDRSSAIRTQNYKIIYKEVIGKISLDQDYSPKTSKYVQATDSRIVELANKIVGDTTSDMAKLELVNQWIVDNVTYNYSKTAFTQKIDALTTLDKLNAICTGYANLFAALARASGLETKVMTGKARSGKNTVYHQWNEVLIDGTWYFIDPTWNAGSSQKGLTFFSKVSEYPKSHYRAKHVRSY